MQRFLQCGDGRSGRTATDPHMLRAPPDSTMPALIASRPRRAAAHEVASPVPCAIPKCLNEPAPGRSDDLFSTTHLASQECSSLPFRQVTAAHLLPRRSYVSANRASDPRHWARVLVSQLHVYNTRIAYQTA